MNLQDRPDKPSRVQLVILIEDLDDHAPVIHS